MAVTWSGTSGHMQVGIEVWTDGYDTNTPHINVYVRVWARSIAWGYNDDMVVYLRGSVAGDYGFRMVSGAAQTVEVPVGLYTIPDQGQNYAGGPTYSFTVSLGGAADGSSPALSVNWTLPARPPNVPTAPGTNAQNIQATYADIVVTAADGRGAPVDAYQTQVSRNSAFTDLVRDWGGGGGRVNGLTRATNYWYRSRAHNAAGWGAWQATKVFTTLSTAPSAPRTLATTGTPGPSNVSLSWVAPSDNGGRAVSSYQVQAATSADFQQGSILRTVGNVLAYDFTGLTPGLTYYFRVRATNATGTGAWSNVVTGDTLAKNLVKVAEDDWRPFRLWVRRPSGWVTARLWKKNPDETWVQ